VSKWAKINENSPIKHLSEVCCVVLSKTPRLIYKGALVPFQDSQLSLNFDDVLHSTPIVNKNCSRIRSFGEGMHNAIM
jgi:hypothetical protein